MGKSFLLLTQDPLARLCRLPLPHIEMKEISLEQGSAQSCILFSYPNV
jgi:hypothetical protein